MAGGSILADAACGHMLDKVIDIINHMRMALDPGISQEDEGLFQHEPGMRYLHLLREVLLTYRFLMRKAATELGVSGAEFEVLRQLALADGRSTTSALARDLTVDPAAVTRLVASLQRRELVSREDDERDGRRRPVVLTSAGRDFVAGLHARLHQREVALAAPLDEASIETAMQVLRSIRGALA